MNNGLMALATLGSTVLAYPGDNQKRATATSAMAETFTTMTVSSEPSAKADGSLTISNLNTVNQYGMTTLNFAFASTKHASLKSACAITMTHRSETDLCSPQSYEAWTINVFRHGLNGDWPMDIYLSYYGQSGTYTSSTFTLYNPTNKTSGLACSTAAGATTCKHAKTISVPLSYMDFGGDLKSGNKSGKKH